MRVLSLDGREREGVRLCSFLTSARDSDDMTLVTLPVSAEDVPPESVGVGLQTSTVSAPLLGGTWLVGLVGFSMGLTIGLLTK